MRSKNTPLLGIESQKTSGTNKKPALFKRAGFLLHVLLSEALLVITKSPKGKATVGVAAPYFIKSIRFVSTLPALRRV